MVYLPAILIGVAVGVLAKTAMPKKYLSFSANIALALWGALIGVVLVHVAQPETSNVVANLNILAAIGGSVVAVLGGNWCYEMIAADNPHGNPRIYKDEEPHTTVLH